MESRIYRGVLLGLVAGFAGACFDVDDLAGNDPNGDASQMMVDASSLIDSGLIDQTNTDAGAPPPRVRCEKSCYGDRFCAPDGYCYPKCDANGVCVVATDPVRISEIVADRTSVYFMSDSSRELKHDTFLRKVAADGTDSYVLPEPKDVGALQQDDAFVYWTSSDGLWRIAKDGASEAKLIYPPMGGFSVLPGGRVAIVSTDVVEGVGLVCKVLIGSTDGSVAPVLGFETRDEFGCVQMRIGDDGQLYRNTKLGEVFVFDPATRQDTRIADHIGALFGVVSPYLYFESLDATGLLRKDTRYSGLPSETVYNVPLAVGDSSVHVTAWQFYRDDLYCLSLADGPNAKQRIDHVPLSQPSAVETISAASFTPPGDFYFTAYPFAVNDTHAFVTAQLGGIEDNNNYHGALLYAIPLKGP